MRFLTSRRTCIMLDIAIAIATAVPLVCLAVQYPDMPERIPVHWNIRGEVDRWARRGVISVFFPAILAALLQLLLGMLTRDLWNARQQETVSGEEGSPSRAGD